jgi:hypothetical protein
MRIFIQDRQVRVRPPNRNQYCDERQQRKDSGHPQLNPFEASRLRPQPPLFRM